MKETNASSISRRDFVKTSASIAALAATGNYAFAAGDDKIKVGVIGCGGRGTGAAKDCLNSSPNIEIYAIGELFQDRLDQAVKNLTADEKKNPALAQSVNVPKERQFVGFDAYQKVLACDVDLVILATPPHFRPIHLAAAIQAGKHVFMEKPVAVDPVGVRSVIESAKLAKEKGLGIGAGTQRRHTRSYIETIKRIHDGAIGDLVGGQCYWNQGGLWLRKTTPEMSDMEVQCRNWLYYAWLSGDHIVEQHIHNIDVMNWVFGGPPVKATGVGGRQARTQPEYGNIYDHFAIEFEYENGARILSMCRQQANTSGNRVGERVVGTKGVATPGGQIEGENAWKFEGDDPRGQVQEHADLIASIRAGQPINEGERVAESTLTAILGRTVAYTGREVKFDWLLKSSKLDLSPTKYEFGPLPVAPVPVPGVTELI